MSVVRSPVRSVVRSPVRGVFGAGDTQTDLQRLIALSPSLLIWPANGAGWQGTSGGTLAASGQPLGLGADLSQLQGKTLSEWLATAPDLFGGTGTFDDPAEWTAGTGWAVTGGAAVATAAALGQVLRPNPAFAVIAGRAYQIDYTVTATAGAVSPNIGGTVGTSRPSSGTYSEIIIATNTNEPLFQPRVSAFTGTIDNVTMRELPGNFYRAGTWASPSDAARGTFQNNAINFDGSADYYSLLSAISITESMTVVRAFKRASAGINNVGLGNAATAQPFDTFWLSDNNTYCALGSTSSTFETGNTATGSYVLSARRNASNQIVRRNGSTVNSISAPSVSGSLDVVGRRTSNYNSGEISFLAVFPTELTGADLTLVEQIAAATNGATLS